MNGAGEFAHLQAKKNKPMKNSMNMIMPPALLGRPTWGDLKGGGISAAVAIPLAMGYGMFAFASLGDAFFIRGVLAGLWSAVIVGVICVFMGNRSTTLYAPRVTTTFYLGSVLFGLTHSDLGLLSSRGAPWILAIFLGIIFLGGAFQALFGKMGLGTLIKFTPHPVMAGFQNAAALLLLLVQSANVLGMNRHMPFTQVLGHLNEAHPLSVAVAALTIFVTFRAKSWLPRVPPILVGLLCGSVGYYVLVAFGLAESLGPTMGALPAALLEPMHISGIAGPDLGVSLSTLFVLTVPAALGLAFIASMDALLCERLLSPRIASANDSDRQLVRLGLGNMASALLGGITAGVNLGPSNVSRANGSTSPWSVLINCLVLLATTLLLMPVLAHLPRVALSAIIVVVAIQHFDPWTVKLLKRIVPDRTLWRSSLALELALALVVAISALLLNIVTAVFLGVLIAVSFFTLRMSRSVVRRHYDCGSVRSRKIREPAAMTALTQHGHRVLVFELDGPIFFGSAERLVCEVQKSMRPETCEVILDFRRVNEIDSTGARVMQNLYESLDAMHLRVRFSGLQRGSVWINELIDAGVVPGFPASRQSSDLDHAIESAEDSLLECLPEAAVLHHCVDLDSMDLLRGLDAAQRLAVRAYLKPQHFNSGDVIFREGDAGSELFVITQGCASVELAQAGSAPIRLATFATGTSFGELALLDQQARSATVIADGPLTCYALSQESFDALKENSPMAAIRMLENLGSELSRRMRRANQMLYQMAD